MTKSETREITKLALMHKMGMTDTVARGLSALIRAARTGRTTAQLMQQAREWKITNHPDFIIG